MTSVFLLISSNSSLIPYLSESKIRGHPKYINCHLLEEHSACVTQDYKILPAGTGCIICRAYLGLLAPDNCTFQDGRALNQMWGLLSVRPQVTISPWSKPHFQVYPWLSEGWLQHPYGFFPFLFSRFFSFLGEEFHIRTWELFCGIGWGWSG